jgi:hypothetical protein
MKFMKCYFLLNDVHTNFNHLYTSFVHTNGNQIFNRSAEKKEQQSEWVEKKRKVETPNFPIAGDWLLKE